MSGKKNGIITSYLDHILRVCCLGKLIEKRIYLRSDAALVRDNALIKDWSKAGLERLK